MIPKEVQEAYGRIGTYVSCDDIDYHTVRDHIAAQDAEIERYDAMVARLREFQRDLSRSDGYMTQRLKAILLAQPSSPMRSANGG